MLESYIKLPQVFYRCSAPSYTFDFTYRGKIPYLDILKLLVTALRNQDIKVVLVRVDEDGKLARYSKCMQTCHNLNIIVQTTCGDASSLNVKSETPNKTPCNITRALLMN